ncbi:DHS-like NAD/FAD-binding domain-containing protein [Lipomyces japonicus]|uniref:DHS-like NAD/FAD-binding domain-containing protein n=1 Tax=Lipomyces japonicus TaxID=56871 RepID=UPI0034CD2C09
MSDLSSPVFEKLAFRIASGKFSKIVVMVGAGISTAAGIPDFRSPKTGLYHNLSRLNLPYAEAVFDIDYFRKRPQAFYMLAQELYPGKFQPTYFHSFLKLLHDKGVLLRVYTQNIDTLERIAGVPSNKVIEAHGSFAANHCIDCKAEMHGDDLKSIMEKNEIPRCKKCGGLVKPDIVFFGENLPSRFFKHVSTDLDDADLVIVAGTSLQVHPFAALPSQVSCPRVLINMERVGDFGRRKSDTIYIGSCDEGVKELVDKLGWSKELDRIWKTTAVADTVEQEEEQGEDAKLEVLEKIKSKEEEVEDEEEVEESKEHEETKTTKQEEISDKLTPDVEEVIETLEELKIEINQSRGKI